MQLVYSDMLYFTDVSMNLIVGIYINIDSTIMRVLITELDTSLPRVFNEYIVDTNKKYT